MYRSNRVKSASEGGRFAVRLPGCTVSTPAPISSASPIDRTMYSRETAATLGLMEQGFRSRIGACTVIDGISGWFFLQTIISSTGQSRSQKSGVSIQTSMPFKPDALTWEKISSHRYSWKNMLETAKTGMIILINIYFAHNSC